MPGEEGVLELGHDGVLVAEHAARRAAHRRRSCATALRRISSLTGTDCQPEAFAAGRGWQGATTWRRPYRRTSGPARCPRAADAAPTARSGRRDVPWHGMDLSGTWRAALADDDLRRSAFGLDFDDDGWEPIAGPRPLALHAGLRRQRRPADLPHPLRARRRRRRAPATGSCSTASSTRATSGSTAPTSATRRATSSPTPTRSPTWPASAPEHVLAVEVTCAPPQRPARPSAPHRRVPALGLHRSRRGTPAACGGRCASSATGPVRIDRLRVLCREADDRAGRTCRSRAELDSDEARTVRIRTTVDDRRRARAASSPLATGHQQVEWTFGVDNPRAVVAVVRSATSRCRRSTVAVSVDHELSDARIVRTGLRQVAMRDWVLTRQRRAALPQGRQPRPRPAWRSARRRPRSCAATSSSPREAGLDLVRVQATSPDRSSTTPPTSSACSSGRTSRCSGATPAVVRQQAVRQARRGRRPARPPPVDRGVVRPQRAR